MEVTSSFEEVVRSWLTSVRNTTSQWEPFTRLTVLLCVTPVLPVAALGAALALLQLALVARGVMRRSQAPPLIGAAVLGMAVTSVSLLVLYPLGARTFAKLVRVASDHAPPPFAWLADVIRWYYEQFFPIPAPGTPI
jgi:hypothetical protein